MKYAILFLVALIPTQRYKSVVMDVYDGDTVTASVSLGFNVYKLEKIRLAGIDAPEVKGETSKEGIIVRDSLRNWIMNKAIYLETDETRDKYGRVIGTIWIDTVNVNKKLLRLGLANPYKISKIGE